MFSVIKNNRQENKANKLIEEAKKEADKHKRDTLMEIKEERLPRRQDGRSRTVLAARNNRSRGGKTVLRGNGKSRVRARKQKARA